MCSNNFVDLLLRRTLVQLYFYSTTFTGILIGKLSL
jgi:hypothetical protein